MPKSENRIARLRLFAAKVRELALTFSDPKRRRIMFGLAAKYEAIAERDGEAKP